MTLQELSIQYEASAQLLRERSKELRAQLKRAEDPEEIWHLKRRIAELAPMLTQMNELAELTAQYYEKGYYRNENYSFNGLQRGAKAEANRCADEDCSGGIDGIPTGYAYRMLSKGEVTDRSGKRKGRKQIYSEQDPRPSIKESPALREVFMSCDDSLLDSILGCAHKRDT